MSGQSDRREKAISCPAIHVNSGGRPHGPEAHQAGRSGGVHRPRRSGTMSEILTGWGLLALLDWISAQ